MQSQGRDIPANGTGANDEPRGQGLDGNVCDLDGRTRIFLGLPSAAIMSSTDQAPSLNPAEPSWVRCVLWAMLGSWVLMMSLLAGIGAGLIWHIAEADLRTKAHYPARIVMIPDGWAI